MVNPRDCHGPAARYPRLVQNATQRVQDTSLAGHVRRRAWILSAALGCIPYLATAKSQPARPAVPPAVETLLAASGLPLSSFGLLVQPAGGSSRELVSLNADQPLQLASTTKLVTTLAALDLLGPDYRWRTRACLDGMLHGGRLLGDLVIVGGGDFSLSSEGLRRWFAELRERGLREIWGDIVLDRFAFHLTEDDHANTPPPTPDQPGHARPDALMLDEGVLRVALHAGPKRTTQVRLVPGQSDLAVINRVTGGSGCSATAELEEANLDSRLVIRGAWNPACGDREIAQLAIPHAELTHGAVAELWRDAGGGRIRGRVRSRVGAEPDTSMLRGLDGDPLQPWATLSSPPLSSLIRDINKSSDNLAARSVFLSLAGEFPQRAATLPAARERVTAWLRGLSLNDDDISVDNGSGLSPTEKGKPRALVQLLLSAWQGPNSRAFVDSLPIAGVDGTLARRMANGPATGRAHLKTGTTSGARALAGYVNARSGRSFAVAAIVNHPNAASATPVLDGVIEWLATNG